MAIITHCCVDRFDGVALWDAYLACVAVRRPWSKRKPNPQVGTPFARREWPHHLPLAETLACANATPSCAPSHQREAESLLRNYQCPESRPGFDSVLGGFGVRRLDALSRAAASRYIRD